MGVVETLCFQLLCASCWRTGAVGRGWLLSWTLVKLGRSWSGWSRSPGWSRGKGKQGGEAGVSWTRAFIFLEIPGRSSARCWREAHKRRAPAMAEGGFRVGKWEEAEGCEAFRNRKEDGGGAKGLGAARAPWVARRAVQEILIQTHMMRISGAGQPSWRGFGARCKADAACPPA